jgi:predicted DNA-binding antitoxin AbrB/MazE fold protein
VNHDVEAVYDHGVFRPITPLALPEGARVQLNVKQPNGEAAVGSNLASDYERWLEKIAGCWQGEFVRGDEGTFETRGPLS